MSRAFSLGHIFGIEVRLHFSWFIIFVLVTVSLVYPDWTKPVSWAIGVVGSLLFFASVLAHEIAHSLVGRANGVTIRSITLFIFGGMARMTREATKAGAEFRMALAGPASSVAIAAFFGLLGYLTGGIEPVAAMALRLALVNLILAVFNVIPGFPLDGGRVFRSILWRATGNYRRSTRIATYLGRGVAYLFILSGILIAFFRPLDLSWFDGLWIVFIGLFLDNAASASYRQVRWHEGLQGLTAADLMTADFPLAPPDITISELVQRHVLVLGRRVFVVANEDKLQGVLTLNNIKSVAQQKWNVTRVRDIMTPLDRLKVARPEQDALSLMQEMDEGDVDQMPVVSGDKVIGLVDRDNLVRFLRTRSELGV